MEKIITDATGRKIELRRVGVVEQLRLFKALGPELSINSAYMNGALIGAAVSMIDGVPMPFPSSEASLEASLEKIGIEAMPLIAKAIERQSDDKMMDEAGN